MLQSSKVVNIGGFNLSTLSANVLGSKDRSLSQLLKKLYANNEKGFAYDPLDSTVAKVALRRNLLTETEFRNGISDVNTRFGTISATTFAGLNEGTGIRIDNNAVGTVVYKEISFAADSPYVFSCFVRTLDGTVPVLGDSSSSATTDFCLVAKGTVITSANTSLISMGNGLYRAIGIVPVGAAATTNFGVKKYVGNSVKPIVVSGFQLEKASAVSEYQPFRTIPLEYPALTLYQDSSGAFPLSGSSQPVGLMLDKSRGLSLGAELFANQPSTIEAGTGGAVYTHNAATRSVTITTAGTVNGYPRLSVNLGLVTGEHYLVQGKITGNGKVNGLRLATSGGVNQLNYDPLTGVFSGIQIATAPVINVLADGTQTGTLTVSELSVKKLNGVHAYQSTSAQRPLYQNGKIIFDGIDDNLTTTLPSQLTGCTVFRAIPNLGTKISFNQTIPANYVDNTSHAGLVVIDRDLTVREKVELVDNLDRRAGAASLDSLNYKSFADANGFSFEPSDLSSMYQDSAGTIPAAAGQPVGLLLDKSKGLALSSEKLSPVSSMTGWITAGQTGNGTVTSNGSSLVFSANGNGILSCESGTLDPKKFYLFSITISAITGTLSLENGAAGKALPITQAGTYTTIASGRGNYYLRNSGVGFVCSATITAASAKELAGNHASQAISASRPTLGRHPFIGIRNLLPYSEDPTKWQGTAVGTGTTPVLTYGVLAPDGTSTATLATFDKGAGTAIGDSSNLFFIPPASNPTSVGSSYTATIWLRTSDSSTKQFRMDFNGATPDSGTSSILTVTGTWQKFTIKIASSTSTSAVMCLSLRGTFATADQASIHIWQPQQEVGLTATTYQKTVTALDVTEAGQPDCWYLKFDGIDDFLQTGDIDLTATDKLSLFAGIRKLSDATVGIVAELSTNANTSKGAFYLAAPNVAASPAVAALFRGTSNASATNTSLASPTSFVMSAADDIPNDSVRLRVNATSASSSTLDQGTGSFGKYPLYIGRRAGTGLSFSGQLYNLVCVGKLISDPDTLAFEKLIAKNTGVTLSV